MALDEYPPTSTEPEVTYLEVRLQGAGAAAPTRVLGKGVTVARSSQGVLTLTHGESPGTYCGMVGPGFDATTGTDVDRWAVVAKNTSATVTTITIYDESGAVQDLPANTWLNFNLRYKRSSVS